MELRNSTDYSESESYNTTDGQSASLSWNKAPIWGLRPDFYYCQTVAGLLIWSVVYNFYLPSWTQSFSGPSPVGLVTIFNCLRFETSLSSPPKTRRATVEVFDPASTGAHDQIFITLWQLRSCFCGASSRTRGRVCLLYMLLALASLVFLRSESLGTRDHILLSQISDFLFVASYDS
jgi:hypothetical protein